MGLETGTYINDLNADNPAPGDPKSQGDDHLRLIKKILKVTFPAFKGPMPIAHDQIASKDYVNQTAFSSALPGQPGGSARYDLTSANGSATWQISSVLNNPSKLADAMAVALYF
jgi:hypothetical protein